MALAKNTVIKLGVTQIASVTSIAWSGRTWAQEDTTNHDASTPVKTTAVTIADNGKITLVVSPYDKTNTEHAALRTLSTSGASQAFTMIQVDTGEQAAFNAFVTNFAYDTPVNGLLKAKVEITVNGEMSLS